LWETDPERARELFRRAWDAAIIVDEENIKAQAGELGKLGEGRPIRFRNHPDLRNEVLRLVAKRDKQLGEEFLRFSRRQPKRNVMMLQRRRGEIAGRVLSQRQSDYNLHAASFRMEKLSEQWNLPDLRSIVSA
jgi:hypothetical protein